MYLCATFCRGSLSLFLVFTGRCINVQAADIVFLIDGSSSIGRVNFLQVKGFMAGIVKAFASSVSQSGIHFGAIQYSDNSRWWTGLIWTHDKRRGSELCIQTCFSPSRVEFTFTTYLTGTEVVRALQNVNYKGGNTRTGAGLKFVADNFFNPSFSRDVPKVWGVFFFPLHVKFHI